ncbi:DUF3099 domain-containing protein [Kineococcus sp. TRM81007]|uniref:DUF3099 domain-containing protein n=1 Tax=Kineococcus sp. TRM81007 TaxID=2925831 RepID=UPI001F580B79|nr:DUF3099 domain-containing protein [Kineococcus sp. TRM81007]MCI2237653.1 DUF3099 domain-containing protein [Kineococcus sp. TRM81007]
MPSHPTPTGGHTAPAEPPGVYRITAAPTAHTDDLGVRYRKYVVSMLVRTACFVLFVVIEHWTRWFFVAGAVFLPYVAVVLANAGRESKGPPPESFSVPTAPVHELPALEARVTSVRSPGDEHPGADGGTPHERTGRAS